MASVAVLSNAIENYVASSTGIMVGYTSLLILVGTILQVRRQIEAVQRRPHLDQVIKQLEM